MIRIGARSAATCLLAVAALAAAIPGTGGASGHAAAPLVDPPHAATALAGPRSVKPAAADPVLVGAGDIARCRNKTDALTADLIAAIPGHVFAAGDLAYPKGSAKDFRNCYGPSWGAFRNRTSPVVGNHEYEQPGAKPYFAYFGKRAGPSGKGWYAYNLGTWRIYVLNSNCEIVRCGSKSAQGRWLRADLAAHPHACVAAIWHHPLFSSGFHGPITLSRRLWRPLAAAGADIVINGHDHDYERFEPQTIDGVASPSGMREFVVGTGGTSLRAFVSNAANSAARNAGTHGVLKLTLSPGAYTWQFVPVEGDSWTDAGTAACT